MIKYIEESIKHHFIESIIYYCEHLIKGDIISQDLQKSREYLSKLSTTKDGHIFLMQGKISYKQKVEYQTASFEKIIDLVLKIQNRKIKYIIIGIVFSLFQQPISKLCFSKNISINKLIHDIPFKALKNDFH